MIESIQRKREANNLIFLASSVFQSAHIWPHGYHLIADQTRRRQCVATYYNCHHESYEISGKNQSDSRLHFHSSSFIMINSHLTANRNLSFIKDSTSHFWIIFMKFSLRISDFRWGLDWIMHEDEKIFSSIQSLLFQDLESAVSIASILIRRTSWWSPKMDIFMVLKLFRLSLQQLAVLGMASIDKPIASISVIALRLAI